MEAAVRFVGVHKAFGKNRIYEDLALEIRRGEILTILGGSGSGKSVMLKMMLGLVSCDRGELWIGDQEISSFNDAQLLPIRRRVGMLFQAGALFDSMSVLDNIGYAMTERGEDRAAVTRRVSDVLDLVGLAGHEALLPQELSGGMKKRVALARAICAPPEILLYDEPTTGLDPTNVRRISELILTLRRELGLTSVVVTHDLASAFMVSDRLAMLSHGRIVELAPSAEFRQSRCPEVREFLEAMPLPPNQEPSS